MATLKEREALKLMESISGNLEVQSAAEPDPWMHPELLVDLPATVKVFGSRHSRDVDEHWLDGLSTEDIVRNNAVDCNFFARFMLGDTFRFPFPPAFVAVWNMLAQALAVLQDYVGESKVALGIPRGFAKTTLMKLFCAYAMIHSRCSFILVIGNVGSNAEKSIKDIADLLGQDRVVRLYGDYSATMSVDRQDEKLFTFAGKQCVLKAKGQRSAVRGINIGNRRPDIILMDDVQDEENAKSAIESSGLEDWIFNTLLPAKSTEGGLDIFVGNTYDQGGALLPKLVKDPEWTSLVLGAILEDGTSLWERLHPIKKLLSSYRSSVRLGNEGGWLAQYMNIMDVGRNSKFDSRAMSTHYTEFAAQHKLPADRTANLDDMVQGKFIVVDPASTKVNADEHSILLVYAIGNMPVCRAVHHKQMTPKEAITYTVALMLREHCYVAFVEDVAYQDTLLYWFNEMLDAMRLPPQVRRMFQVKPISPQRRSKTSRILNLFRQLNVGEVLVHPSMEADVISEGRGFDKLRVDNEDNVLDSVHYAPLVLEQHRSLVYGAYEDAIYRAKVEAQQERLGGGYTAHKTGRSAL